MKQLLSILICSVGCSMAVLAQAPAVTPAIPGTTGLATPSATPPAVTQPATPAVSASPDPSSLAGRIHKKVTRNLHNKGFNIEFDGDSDSDTSAGSSHGSNNDIPGEVIPIVALAVFGVFGAPVLAFAILMYFGFSKNRMMHRTIRMMVEKGQPVPAALLNPPPAVRKRSDMRRGVVLVMIGIGIMVFFAAVTEGEGGAWALGVIPFLIGAGYLLVWKLEGKIPDEAKADNPPPLP